MKKRVDVDGSPRINVGMIDEMYSKLVVIINIAKVTLQ